MSLDVHVVPCLQDNFAYLLRCLRTGRVAVVDPSEAAPVLEALKARGWSLDAILNTHHHWDHTGGNLELLDAYPGIPVYGHASDRGRIEGQTVFLEDGDSVELGECRARIYHIPGHTTGAVAYHFPEGVFTGDTLFAVGCGRLFEGTPEMMDHSLNDVLAALPGETPVYFGHEYTRQNIRFALTVEPSNEALRARADEVEACLAEGKHTTPTTIELERRTNPFLRCDQADIRARFNGAGGSRVEIFARLREAKDNF